AVPSRDDLVVQVRAPPRRARGKQPLKARCKEVARRLRLHPPLPGRLAQGTRLGQDVPSGEFPVGIPLLGDVSVRLDSEVVRGEGGVRAERPLDLGQGPDIKGALRGPRAVPGRGVRVLGRVESPLRSRHVAKHVIEDVAGEPWMPPRAIAPSVRETTPTASEPASLPRPCSTAHRRRNARLDGLGNFGAPPKPPWLASKLPA